MKPVLWHNCYDSSWKGLITDAEMWKPVVGSESFYEVSDFGRVRSKHKVGANPGGILCPVANEKGYLRISLSCGSKRFSRVVHRLVLEAFVGPQPSPIHECNHKDGKKGNNALSNLEWVTPVENNAHSVASGFWHPHIGEAHGRAKLKSGDVEVVKSLKGKSSAKELARRFGVSDTAIRLIWNSRNWKHVHQT